MNEECLVGSTIGPPGPAHVGSRSEADHRVRRTHNSCQEVLTVGIDGGDLRVTLQKFETSFSESYRGVATFRTYAHCDRD